MSDALNIAMIVRSFSTNGGLELYAHKVIEGLLARGHKVTVLCEESTSSLSHDNLQIRFWQATTAKRKAQRLKDHFENASRALSEAGTFDIVHSQHLPVKGASVVTFHNHTVYQLDRVGMPTEKSLNRFKRKYAEAYRLRDTYDEMLCKEAACLVFPSRVMRDDFFETYQLGSAPSVVAYPGASLGNEEQPSRNNSAPGDPFTFLFVGKGYRKKGLGVLLGACTLLKRRAVRFRLIIAGLRMKPIDALRLQLLGLHDFVKYLGFQENMAAVYEQADAFVLPSRMEPFGMAPLQAMRWGIPAIVSKVSGVSELIDHEVNGLILQNHKSPNDLAKLMQRLVKEEELLSKLQSQAASVAQQATWSKTVDSTLEAYRLAVPASEKSRLA